MVSSRFLLPSLFVLAVRTSAFFRFDRSFVITSNDVDKEQTITITTEEGQYYAYATFSSVAGATHDNLDKITILDDDTPDGESGTSIYKLHSTAPLTNNQGGLGFINLNTKNGGNGIRIRNAIPKTPITPTQQWVVYIVDVNLNKCPVYDTYRAVNILMSTEGKDCPNTATILNAGQGFSLSQFAVKADDATWDVYATPEDVQKDQNKVLHIPNYADAHSSFTHIAGPIATVVARHKAGPLVPMEFYLSTIRNYNRTVGENAVFSVSSPGFVSPHDDYSYAWSDSGIPTTQEYTMTGKAPLHFNVRVFTNEFVGQQSVDIVIGPYTKTYQGNAAIDVFDSAFFDKVHIGVKNGGGNLPRYAIQVEQSSSPKPAGPASSPLPSDSSSPRPGDTSTKGASHTFTCILNALLFFSIALRM